VNLHKEGNNQQLLEAAAIKQVLKETIVKTFIVIGEGPLH
jgi:hypothetical protein